MMNWNTSQIVDDLKLLPEVGSIAITEPGGDFDTTNLMVYPTDDGDKLFVCGFNVDGQDMTSPDLCDVEMVEVTDGLDSRGGLNSYKDSTGLLFLVLRKYFHNKGAFVVDRMNDYF